MSLARTIDARTRANQGRASNPAHSAWVSAHAGSGKTHVLASRVIRLLLDGVAPARILCLTFTKAAAANMSTRVFETLAKWAIADDPVLRAELTKLEIAPLVSLDIARKLFARAVETPGGLKIQTIHAFCERVLHLFPFEANVAANFRVVEEAEEAELLALAQRKALSELAGSEALARVADGLWEGKFVELVKEMRAHRRTQGVAAAQARRALLGLAADEDEASLCRAICQGGIAPERWSALADRLAAGSSEDVKCARRLRDAAAFSGPAAANAYLAVFRTATTNAWRESVLTKGLRKSDPELAVVLDGEIARLKPLYERWLAARVDARTSALETVCDAILAHYTRFKQLRALLDFDDLIVRTDELLAHPHASQWVLFKLDGGIDHILVDEAQDTSEPQWRILEALSREFFAGAGRSRAHRTFFAVGDEKQSIFSFQGAAPTKFDAARRYYESRAVAAEQSFAHVPLHMSFRSSPIILQAVDTVFHDETRRHGLSSDDVALVHEALKADLPGLVEIWEPMGAMEAAPPDSWLLPVDRIGDHEPPAKLAHKIATKIKQLLDPARHQAVEGSKPGSRRLIAAGDIMILVRRRDAFFEAMIRSLKDLQVPVAGADRLDVVGHIAVMDCAAVGRIALLPDDDLALATVLKTPFLGLHDDDLIALAPNRTGSLYDALLGSAEPRHAEAAARIAHWRDAAKRLRPFEFFAALLGAEGGRSTVLARLGPEANDALDEFLALALAHERTAAPSLLSFLATIETLTLNVKRDLEAAGDAVRVMTVHAAKGLEAKIVFLPDTCGSPVGQNDPSIYVLGDDFNRTIAWSGGKPNDPAPLIAARDAKRRAQDEEYRRLLYVAMTRAEERLYIAGYYNKVEPKAECWYAMVREALEPLCRVAPDTLEDHGEILQFGTALELDTSIGSKRTPAPLVLPDWLTTNAAREAAPAPPLRPSSALAGADARNADERAIVTRALQRGLAVHALLRRLAAVSSDRREAQGTALLAASWPDLGADHPALLNEALAVLNHPELSPLFGPESLAEVALTADLPRTGLAPARISGQIDRIAETDDAVLVADFKTGATAAALQAAHVAQIALYAAALAQIYPGRQIQALLIYTAGPTIFRLDEQALAQARSAALAAA